MISPLLALSKHMSVSPPHAIATVPAAITLVASSVHVTLVTLAPDSFVLILTNAQSRVHVVPIPTAPTLTVRTAAHA